MFYQIIIAYFAVRIVFDALLDDGINETDIRKCNCSPYIELNHHRKK